MNRHIVKKAVVLTVGAVVATSFVLGALLGIAVAIQAERDRGTEIPVDGRPGQADE